MATLVLGSMLLGQVGAQPSLDAITVDSGDTTLLSSSFSHETPAATDRLLLVSTSWDDANELQISSITYGGEDLTCLSPARNAGKIGSQLCYLIAPPTGSNTVEVTWTADVAEWVVVARSFSEVDQNDPIGATAGANGSSTTASQSLTTTEADSAVAAQVGTVDADVSLTPNTGTDEDTETTAGLSSLGISSAAGRVNTTSAGSYTPGWDISSSRSWALALAELHRSPEEVSFDQASSSGDESTTPASLTLSLDKASSGDITVDYSVTGGNATTADHNLSDGSVTFQAGETSKTIDVEVTGDTSDEPDETIEVTLSNPAGAVLGSTTKHTYTILDDDPNHAPDPSAASISTDEDTDVSDTVTATDQDQGDTIDSFAVDSQPSHGSLTFDTSTGDFTYSPDADYNGDDSFTFIATDNHGATSTTATVSITVNAVDDAPTAEDDSASTEEDTSVTVDVGANDEDVDGDALSVVATTSPSNGAVTSNGDGTITYEPDTDFNGADSFTYEVSDGSLTDPATVSVTVNAVNDAPTALDDSASTDEDATVWIDVLANDSDVDGDGLSVASTTSPANGATSVPGNGTVAYTPDADYNGDDSFTYDVSDGSLTDTATVTVTVNAVDDAPSAGDDSASTDEDTSVTVDVGANDEDVDGDALSVVATTSPSNGAVSTNGDGTITYTPDADFNGDDSFTYDVSDGSLTDPATVTVTVNAVNDAPSAGNDAASTAANETVWVSVVVNDSDVDGDTLSVASATDPANGTTNVPGNGTVRYTPDPDFSGTDSFSYTVTDGALSATATVSVDVSASTPNGTNTSTTEIEILSTNVRAIGGTLDGTPTINTTAFGSSLELQLENATGGIDLTDLGADTDTTLEISLTVRNFEPRVLMGRADVEDWSKTTNNDGTTNISLQLDPIAMAFIDDCERYNASMGYCGPSSVEAWPTNASEDQADIAFDAAVRIFLSDLSYMPEEHRQDLDGGFMTTDAQALGQMNVSDQNSSAGPSLNLSVAGPHTLPNGTTNSGFFEARLPTALLDSWGVDDVSTLTGTYGSEDRSLTVTEVDEGVLVSMDIHYSSGTVSIAPDASSSGDGGGGGGNGGGYAPPSEDSGSTTSDDAAATPPEDDAEDPSPTVDETARSATRESQRDTESAREATRETRRTLGQASDTLDETAGLFRDANDRLDEQRAAHRHGALFAADQRKLVVQIAVGLLGLALICLPLLTKRRVL